MIIKLPVCAEDKILFMNFHLEKSDNEIELTLFNRNYEKTITKLKIPFCNNFEGISYVDLFFPLKLKIINKKIIFNNFFQKILLSQNNLAIDFFIVLEKYLIKEYELEFIKKEDFVNCESRIWDYWSNYIDTIPTTNYLETIQKIWEVSQLYLNFSLFLIYLKPEYTNKTIKDYTKKYKLNKKILNLANTVKTLKFSIYSSNDYTFNEHYLRISEKKAKLSELKIGFKYFIKSLEGNKFFEIEVANIKDNIIHTDNNQVFLFNNYEWYFYISNLDFDFDIIFFNLIINAKTYEDFFERCDLKIEPIHCKKLLEYYFNNNYECSLIYLRKYFNDIFSDFNLLKKNNYSNAFFNYVLVKYREKEDILEILKILFSNYSYPIKLNKIDRNFDHILYFSFYNINKLYGPTLDNSINEFIPMKVKNLYFNLTNLFYQVSVKNNFQFLINTQKFYNDYLHRVIIKILFTNNKLLSTPFIISKLNSVQLDKISNIIKNMVLCIDVTNRLFWSNLPKRLNYLNILYENKELIFYADKLNRNIFPENFDSRLKKIIESPYEMFKYLRNEKDFIKWIKFMSNKLSGLFYNQISLSSDDLDHLGKIIFLLVNIKEQNIKNESYMKFINYCQKHNKLILDNTRINLKIKENFGFLKTNINLGFLARHLTFGLRIDLDYELEKTQDLINIEELLRKVVKKYHKYKVKYVQSKKTNATEMPLSVTSTNFALGYKP